MVTAVGAAVFVVVVTLAVDPGGLSPFGPLRWTVVTTGIFVLAFLTARPPRRARPPRQRMPRTIVVAFGVLLAWLAVSAVFGLDPVYAWIGTPERHGGVIAWVVAAIALSVGHSVGSSSRRRTVAIGVATAAAAAGAWAVAESLGWEPMELAGAGARPVGPFGSSAYLGAAGALFAPVAVGLATDAAIAAWTRVVAVVASGAAVAALVLSGARAAWVGTVVAVTIVVVARRRSLTRHSVIAGTAMAGAAVALALASGVDARVVTAVTDEKGGVRGRIDEWRVASRVVRSDPVVGVGPEGYRIAFASVVDAAYEREHGRTPLPDRAHASVLDVAVAGGLPAAAAYAVLVGLVVTHLARAVGRGDAIGSGLAAGGIAYLVQAQVLFPIAELDPLAWLVVGAAIAQPHDGDGTAGSRAHPRRGFPIVVGVSAISAASAFMAGVLDVGADRIARETLGARPGAPAADQAARLRPDAIRYRLVAARVYAASGAETSLTRAIDELDSALVISPRDPVVERERAALILRRARRSREPADIGEAVRELRRLARHDPYNAETALRLGLALALAGDDEAAERAWRTAERLAPRSAAPPTNLAISYARRGLAAEAKAAAERALAVDPNEPRAQRVLEEISGEDGT